MAYIIDENGNIELVQGDSVSYSIGGLPTDKNYTVHFAIQNTRRNPVGDEITVFTNGNSSIVFELVPELTDLLTVKQGEEVGRYYFGIKLCDEESGLEDTLQLGNSKIGDINTITVYPKKVEGLSNG